MDLRFLTSWRGDLPYPPPPATQTAGELLHRSLLALCVWRESRGESTRGKYLVACVVLNRATDVRHRWPRTIRDVVLQPFQFSAFNEGDPNARQWPKPDDLSWRDSVLAVNDALSQPDALVEVNHYHTIAIRPSWADGQTPICVEGHHAFYAL